MHLSLFVLLAVTTSINALSAVDRMEFPRQVSASSFNLLDDYRGQGILDQFNFFSEADPTNGLVEYQTKANAVAKGLAFVDGDATVLAVDNKETIATGAKRASVRLESKKKYSKGLFIADFAAMPFGCSTWPAWWTYSDDYPNGGEIDVIEGVHNQNHNELTYWYAGSNICTFPASSLSGGSGQVYDQNQCSKQTSEQNSCTFLDNRSQSYGSQFNTNGGGVYAHLVDSDAISIWFFARSSIPSDITSQKPNPSTWGKPVAQWKSTECDLSQHVREHKLTINTSLCGDWAGDADAWRDSGCPGTCAGTVANPKNFDNARWRVKYISVYQAA